MVRTQIQLSDELYHSLKKVAEAKEWSLAEAVRRGAELLLRAYPSPSPASESWFPPKPRRLGWRGLGHAEVREAAVVDAEPVVPSR